MRFQHSVIFLVSSCSSVRPRPLTPAPCLVKLNCFPSPRSTSLLELPLLLTAHRLSVTGFPDLVLFLKLCKIFFSTSAFYFALTNNVFSLSSNSVCHSALRVQANLKRWPCLLTCCRWQCVQVRIGWEPHVQTSPSIQISTCGSDIWTSQVSDSSWSLALWFLCSTSIIKT